MIRRQRRRRLGYGLLAFGLSGLVLLLAAAALVFGSLAAVDDAATGFEEQRAELLAMLGPASSALDGAATSATNASASLTSSAGAAERAATLTTRLASSFEGLAALSTFEILGSRRPQAQGRAVPQEHVANERLRRHAHSSQWWDT